MTKRIVSFIKKHGAQLCGLAVMVSPAITQCCRFLWYQPEEPEGLADFAKAQRTKATEK